MTTPNDKAIAFIRKLVEAGDWHWTVIELHFHEGGIDGNHLLDEAKAILAEADRINPSQSSPPAASADPCD